MDRLKDLEAELKLIHGKIASIQQNDGNNYNKIVGEINYMDDSSYYMVTLNNDAVRCVTMVLKQGYQIQPHTHMAKQEFIVLEGSIEIQNEGEIIKLQKGGKKIIASLTIHSVVAIEDSIVISNLFSVGQY